MDTMQEPWRPFYREFAARADRVPADAFERSTLLYDAAHDAYERGTNELTAAGVDGERALMVGRLFGSVVKDWVDNGGPDLGSLESQLRAQFDRFEGAGH